MSVRLAAFFDVKFQRAKALITILLALTAGCVYPQPRRLPEIRGQLLDGGSPVARAKIGYCWDWSKAACDESLRPITTAGDGRFVLPQHSGWGVGLITPFPDYGRAGWQLCFESPDGRRRYFRTWWENGGVANLSCDIGRAETEDVCSWLRKD